ncbi:hypothetical protein AB4305_04585 [Nocardia sp. 2YAB30]|uniref:hypothetical protein n=1 Tax=Nocardia sp. 2YAB30 TaxID=3233022 RepID=UPI003F944447
MEAGDVGAGFEDFGNAFVPDSEWSLERHRSADAGDHGVDEAGVDADLHGAGDVAVDG